MATKKIKEDPETFYHVALKNVKLGSKKDGTPKKIINKGDKLSLTKSQEKAYRIEKIIK